MNLDFGTIALVVFMAVFLVVSFFIMKKMTHSTQLLHLKMEIIANTDFLARHEELIKQQHDSGGSFGEAFNATFEEAFPPCYEEAVKNLTFGEGSYPVSLEEARESLRADIASSYLELLGELEADKGEAA